MEFLQFIGDYLSNLVGNPIAAQLLSGAGEGIVIGLVVGAIVWAIMQAPDTLGRALLFGIFLGIIVVIWEFARIGAVVGGSMGSIINSLNENPIIGGMIMQAGIRTVAAMLIGAAIGVGSLVPQLMIKGAIIGLFLGALAGAALRGVFDYFNISLSRTMFQGAVVVVTWGLLVTFSGKQ